MKQLDRSIGAAAILLSLWLLSSSKLSELRDVLVCILTGVISYVRYELIGKKQRSRNESSLAQPGIKDT